MDLFPQQPMPPSLQKLQFQAKALEQLLDLEDNRTLPGSLAIRLGISDLVEHLAFHYPPKRPTQMEMFQQENNPRPRSSASRTSPPP